MYYYVSRCCDAREAHARCTAPGVAPGARAIKSGAAIHYGKTSPGGVGLSCDLARPSGPAREQRCEALPCGNETTEEGEQDFVHGFRLLAEGTASAPMPWLARHPE